MDWRRSLAQSMKGLPQDVLEEIQGDDAFRTALAASDLPAVVEACSHRQRIVEDQLQVFRERHPRLDRLSRRVDRRFHRDPVDVEYLETLIEWGDFPSAPRDELNELAWYMGEVDEMSGLARHLQSVAEEAQLLLEVQEDDERPKPQRRYQPRNEWRL